MPVTFTTEQQKAIDSRGGRLLVSAAAGSGKTAVLVQRVINLICDGDRPLDVDRLLVVTYTNAAAAEMRSKIASALLDRLAAEPGNVRLRRQLALLPSARIETVHAFCMGLVRDNFALCGVSPDFTLSDETEYALLKDAAMEDALENAYAEGSPQFEALCAAFCEERGDRRLAEIVREIYEKLRSHPDPDGWLARAAAQGEAQPPEETDWGRYLMESARRSLAFAADNVEQTLRALQSEPDLLEKYSPVLTALLDFAGEARLALDRGWDEAVRALRGFVNPRLPAVRGGDEGAKAGVKRVKGDFADRVRHLSGKVLCAESADIARETRRAQPLIAGLCRLTRDFGERYAAEKKRRNLLDFSDLEHLALGLLTDGKGEKTPLACQLSAQLGELLVDEYQDTNEIQDRIFDAVAPQSGGVFQVGDVKQSIYRFRLAEPEIFVGKYQRYADFDGAEGGERRLPLNRNFRSRREVLEVCNFVFSRVMSRQFGDVDYGEGERLVYGAEYYQGSCPSELCVIDMAGAREDEESPEKAQAEARWVAGRIAGLLQTQRVTEKDGSTRPARPGDVAVLLSSFRSKAPYYRQALESLRIPAAAGEGGFFEAMEIEILLSFLRIIDNRRQDIPLISVLRSPLFFFSPDDLAEIRLCDREGAFCDALGKAARTREDARAFVALLDELCARAADLTVSELLQLIFARTGALGVFAALENGEDRRRNLRRLLDMAIAFEGRSARGVHAFLRFVDRRAEEGGDPPGAPASADAVQLVSIHKSKGLEYPIVFVPDLAKPFNMDDLKKPVLFHEKMGIGIKLRDEDTHAEYTTQQYRAVAALITAQQRAEELRKLYVAMTRAREKLVMTVALPDAAKKLEEWAALARSGGPIDPEALAGQTSAAMWVCAPLLTHPAAGALRERCSGAFFTANDAESENLRVSVAHYTETPDAPRVERAAPEGKTQDYSRYLERRGRQYAYADVSALPSKLTPTGAKRLVPDAGEIADAQGRPQVRFYHSPQQGGADARARGTATHLFLCLADYARCRQEDGVRRELQRLLETRRMTRQQVGLVDLAAAERYLRGPLAERALRAGRMLREYEFGALFSPRELLGSGREEESILMNGTIDLLLFEGDGLCIVDFKTDRVRAGQEAGASLRHRMQLDIYASAAEKIFGLPVRERIVYYLATGCAFPL